MKRDLGAINELLAAAKSAIPGIDVRPRKLPNDDLRGVAFTFPLDGAWTVSGQADLIAGRLVLTQVHIDFDPLAGASVATEGTVSVGNVPTAGISTPMLRRIPFRKLLRAISLSLQAEEPLARVARAMGFPADVDAGARAAAVARRDPSPTSRGRPRELGDDHWRAVSAVALSAEDAGKPLWGTIAAYFQVSEGTAREWLRAARRHGFLEPATRGRRDVRLGPRLRESNQGDE